MNRAYKIKYGLEKTGEKIFFKDGNWISPPFFAVIQPRWKNNKSDFELKETEIGRVSTDYYTYIGPFDHNILALSDSAVVYADGNKYLFRKRDSVKTGNQILYYTGVLRKVWEENDAS